MSTTDYNLPRDHAESSRLTSQHYHLTARQGYILHPNITASLPPNPAILDIATGNGIWACDLARNLPDATITGLDVSDAQFFPPSTLPRNVSLGKYDILTDVPEIYTRKFDVVHVRLLLPAGPTIDWKEYVAKLGQFLKPGGWMQLDDLGFHVFLQTSLFTEGTSERKEVLRREDLEVTPVSYELAKYLPLEKRLGWMGDFAGSLDEVGGWTEAKREFVPVLSYLCPVEDRTLGEVVLGMYKSISDRVGGQDERIETMRRAAEIVTKDQKTALKVYNWNVCVAKKV